MRIHTGHALPEPPSHGQVDKSVRHTIWEIAWWGITVGLTVNFLSVYVVRLNAPTLLVSTLTYGPTLITMFGLLPAGQLIRRSRQRRRWMLGSVFATRLAYAGIAMLPFFIQKGRAELTVFFIILQAIPGTMAGISTLSALADTVPIDQMADVQGKRMAAYGLTVTISNLLASQILLRLPFPLNYQTLFVLGFFASMGSLWHIAQWRLVEYAPRPVMRTHFIEQIRRALQCGAFARFITSAAIFQVAVGMLAPLVPLFYVRQLGASDFQVSILAITSSGTMMISSLLMRNISYQIKRERLLAVGVAGHALYPILFSLAPSVWWLVPFAIWANFFGAAIAVSLFADLMEITPAGDRTEFIGVFTLAVNLAVFLGSLSAGLLARGTLGLHLGLYMAATINLLAAGCFWYWFVKMRDRTLCGEEGLE